MKTGWIRAAVLLLAGSPLAAWATELIGAGSFIPAPLYAEWGEAYSIRTANTTIKYQGSSPADGIKRVSSNSVDFGGIDMPLNIAELNQKGLVQFPVALSAVAPIVNLKNVYPGQLRLDGKTLGDIFLGKINKWNDPALIALNPQVSLPDATIIVAHRVTPFGIRTVIGDYLAKVHPEWKAKMGDGMSGNWPAG